MYREYTRYLNGLQPNSLQCKIPMRRIAAPMSRYQNAHTESGNGVLTAQDAEAVEVFYVVWIADLVPDEGIPYPVYHDAKLQDLLFRDDSGFAAHHIGEHL